MKRILIVTGGSGGHVIPALSIYDHLKNDFNTSLVSDIRGTKYINKDKYLFNLIDVPNLFSKLYLLPINLIKFIYCIFQSFSYLKKKNINILISTGGYMSLPICLAARILKIKIIIFEPNCVIGRTNRVILGMSHKIICHNKELKFLPNKYNNKIYLIDPILRKEIYLCKKNEKEDFEELKKIIIIGGSQGAKFFDQNITNLILNLSKKLNLQVCQQYFDTQEKVILEKKYNMAGVKFEIFKFDENLFQNINDFDLAITRSGASSISELSFLNIPFIAIPFPFARDDHQFYNAKYYEKKNCCWLVPQNDFDIIKIENLILSIFKEKIEYFDKKKNLKEISNQNTWNNINKKLIGLINES